MAKNLRWSKAENAQKFNTNFCRIFEFENAGFANFRTRNNHLVDGRRSPTPVPSRYLGRYGGPDWPESRSRHWSARPGTKGYQVEPGHLADWSSLRKMNAVAPKVRLRNASNSPREASGTQSVEVSSRLWRVIKTSLMTGFFALLSHRKVMWNVRS